MKLGIVEYGGELSDVFIREVSAQIMGVEHKKKMALDIFDVLAFAKKMTDMDQLVIIAALMREDKEINSAFFEGLAVLESETGKNIFKCIYYEDEDGEALVKGLAETFINYLYHPEKLRAPPAGEEGAEAAPPGFP